jgi:hypothetical protein
MMTLPTINQFKVMVTGLRSGIPRDDIKDHLSACGCNPPQFGIYIVIRAHEFLYSTKLIGHFKFHEKCGRWPV